MVVVDALIGLVVGQGRFLPTDIKKKTTFERSDTKSGADSRCVVIQTKTPVR
jgi:hypothetical protein